MSVNLESLRKMSSLGRLQCFEPTSDREKTFEYIFRSCAGNIVDILIEFKHLDETAIVDSHFEEELNCYDTNMSRSLQRKARYIHTVTASVKCQVKANTLLVNPDLMR